MRKVLALFLSLFIAISFVGCSNDQDDSGDLNDSESLSETETPYTLFNGSERSIWYVHARPEEFGKDYEPHEVFIFENGEVTVYNNYGDTAEKEIFLTYGQISKMDDKEIIDHLNSLKEAGVIKPLTQEVNLHIYTDNTGNKVKKEVLLYNKYDFSTKNETGFYKTEDLDLGLLFPMSQALEVYDSFFAGFVSDRYVDSLFLTKVDGHFGFALDEIGTEGIEID